MGNQAIVRCWFKIRHIWSGMAGYLCGVDWHLLAVCLHLVGQEGYSAGSKDSPAEKGRLAGHIALLTLLYTRQPPTEDGTCLRNSMEIKFTARCAGTCL